MMREIKQNVIKEKIEVEAMNLNYFPKQGELPV